MWSYLHDLNIYIEREGKKERERMCAYVCVLCVCVCVCFGIYFGSTFSRRHILLKMTDKYLEFFFVFVFFFY